MSKSLLDTLKQEQFISFDVIRKIAVNLLNAEGKAVRDKLYDELQRGTDILMTERHLDMYLWSFGKMHKAKLEYAFSNMEHLADLTVDDYEIFDWGCGQGIATICLLDYLRQNNLQHRIKRITLVEPSTIALERAKNVIELYLGLKEIEIRCIGKGFDELNDEDVSADYGHAIQLFSNILDVAAFDLPNFISRFQRICKGDNKFICVGPYYSNSIRMDDFLCAVNPDNIYVKDDYRDGEWKTGWTMSIRLFSKRFNRVETVDDIRKRIVDAHKHLQMHAGYILDSVSEELSKLDNQDDVATMLHSLSAFDVRANVPMQDSDVEESSLAVLSNIVSRGLPTLAPIMVEELFLNKISNSVISNDCATLSYHSSGRSDENSLYEALYVIDPRFGIDNYNGDYLESNYEKDFIINQLHNTTNRFLVQLLEPQRELSSMVRIPDLKFVKDQRVDFALEKPCRNGIENKSLIGFICEINGTRYHSSIFSRVKDANRMKVAYGNGWDTYTVEENTNNNFIYQWLNNESMSDYLNILKRNYAKKIEGAWRRNLVLVLTPFAVARLEKVFLEALMSGNLKKEEKQWNILVVERDVPCAVIALKHLKESYSHICKLQGKEYDWPTINLDVVSNNEFCSSSLHCDTKPTLNPKSEQYDLCIDISMLLRDKIDAMPLRVKSEVFYIIRSSHYRQNERKIICADNIKYKPLVSKNDKGEYVPIGKQELELQYFLSEIFRKRSFRTGQLPILSRALSDKTTIGLLPTGGGKSLTYQLSAMMQPGVTLVVDPLVSLMIDQFRGLQNLRIDSCECVNSTQNIQEKTERLNLLSEGALQFVMLSPERFMMENFRNSLSTMSRDNHIYFSYGVIDEVHTVSEWGHDFRPSYLHLGRNMIRFLYTKAGNPISVIGLTATASFDVLADVERELTLGNELTLDSDAIVRPEYDTRPEITYKIVEVKADFEHLKREDEPYILNIHSEWDIKNLVGQSKRQRLSELLKTIPSELEEINQECAISDFRPQLFYNCDENGHYQYAGIIFCPHRRGIFGIEDTKRTTGLRTALQDSDGNKLAIGTFCGGAKMENMQPFLQNEQNVMVATKAFGMGIDKPNVRYTININHPSSIESFVQEAGRGGRDKKNAIAYILYEPTEYICFTDDKINDIRAAMGSSDPVWMFYCSNEYVLKDDLIDFCMYKGCSSDDAKKIYKICVDKEFFENNDKDIELYFHNNSFKGLLKEKVILHEMTHDILNVTATRLTEIQNKLREETGNNDLCLKLNKNENNRDGIKIVSAEESGKQYGFLYLDTLIPYFNFIDFDPEYCRNVGNRLSHILSQYEDHSVNGLNVPINGNNDNTGIYTALSGISNDECVYVTVSWNNQLNANPDSYKEAVMGVINDIANEKGWCGVTSDRLELDKIDSFEKLLQKIALTSNDKNWLYHHWDNYTYDKLKMTFYRNRDKNDTDKAIYRMCCIGLVEDVIIDYNSQTYQLKVVKRSDDEYLDNMRQFFRKYYSLKESNRMVEELRNHKGDNVLDKCMGYLAEFVYKSLEKKRYRALDDMRLACSDGIKEGSKWLKEFIKLYFNSKYAREGYQVGGCDYCINIDTKDNEEDFKIVEKYIKILGEDNSGTPIDNTKHLYGAVLLRLRDYPYNAALNLLRTYCIAQLGVGNNETLKHEAIKGYIDGFLRLDEIDHAQLQKQLQRFNELFSATDVKDRFVIDKILNEGRDLIILNIHSKYINKLKTKYCD